MQRDVDEGGAGDAGQEAREARTEIGLCLCPLSLSLGSR